MNKKSFSYESERDVNNKLVHILLYDTQVKKHFHGCAEILFVIEGKLKVNANNEVGYLEAGEAIFIPPFTTHEVESITESKTETLMIPYRLLHTFRKYYNKSYFGLLKKKDVNKQVYELIRTIYSNIKSTNEYLILALVDLLLAVIANNYQSIPYNKENSIMIDIAVYLNQNFMNISSISEVAEHFGYNTSYFSRLFKKVFEVPFNQYLNHLRCEYIENNLAGNSSISNLIYEAGYSTLSTYYRNKNKQKKC